MLPYEYKLSQFLEKRSDGSEEIDRYPPQTSINPEMCYLVELLAKEQKHLRQVPLPPESIALPFPWSLSYSFIRAARLRKLDGHSKNRFGKFSSSFKVELGILCYFESRSYIGSRAGRRETSGLNMLILSFIWTAVSSYSGNNGTVRSTIGRPPAVYRYPGSLLSRVATPIFLLSESVSF